MNELTIKLDKMTPKQIDRLILGLVHAGFSPYLTEDRELCITVYDSDMHRIKDL